jgi:hypothetical protein
MNCRSIIAISAALLTGCAGHHSYSTAAPTESSAGGMAPPTTTASMAASGEASPYVIEVAQQRAPREAILTASSVGDHDRRGEYLDFLARHPYEVRNVGLDTSRRQRIEVMDATGRPVRGATVSIDGRRVGSTFGDGIFDLYPAVLGIDSGASTLGVSYGGSAIEVPIAISRQGDGESVSVRLEALTAPAARRLELAFLVDVTGSMEDELRYVNHEVGGIVERVRDGAHGIDVRVAATFYRDRGDDVPLSKIDFTRDVDGFARAMAGVTSAGGGDYPEDLDAGLDAALHRLSWSEDDAVRVVVLITDAPAQSYQTQFDYREAVVEAGRRGIRILPVAASGANRTVEVMLRAMGTYTGAPYIFLTDDSGVGESHLEADTDRIRVEHFSVLLTRLLLADLVGVGMHEPGYGGVADFAQ